MRKALILLSLLAGSFFNGYAQQPLFQQRSSLSRDYHQVASKYQALMIDRQSLQDLHRQSPEKLELSLPFENGQLKLELQKTKITVNDFSVIEALPNGERRKVDYNEGVFYQGTIDGKSKSFATISIFNDQVMGIIADEKSNIILGAIENNGRATSEYTLYRNNDLNIPNPFTCGTGEIPVDGLQNLTISISSNNRAAAVGEPVEVYFECDYQFYLDKGSNTTTVINYVLGFFNNTALLYNNENIKVQVSQVLVWTTQDPESAAGLNTTSAVLPAFRDRMISTNYIGDYAHFLSTRSLGGGIAYLLNSPCTTAKQFRSAVSQVYNTYSNFPTYSWTVEVVTHEFGHNLGSNHTQWCGWVGGALDNCYTTEGGCPPGPQPSNGGTIMSYCHLVSTGINFNNGFGTQPGDKIRSVVTGATCFGNCRMTIDVTKLDASCGQNNGSATVTATNNTGALTYAWSNGQNTATLTNVGPGTYHVKVTDAAGCQVMQVVTIVNTGSSLTATLAPSGTASFCTGTNITLTATNNPAYTYVWRKDGNVINGATSNSYVASAGGVYSVTVSSGSCSVVLSVTVSEVTTPVANISAGGPTTFCDGNSVVLNGNAGAGYTYQWYNNTVLINGATNPTYTATIAGSYTVRISAGASCQATSSAVVVTVNPSPAANITTNGPASFCSGGSLVLTANTGTGFTYQWYRNAALINGATNSTYTATTGGNYTVTITKDGCSRTSAATTVTVFASPSITVTPTVSTIQKYQTQVLTATGAASYNWNAQPALVNAGTNIATFKPLTTTVYTIQGTDNNNCTGTATATIIVIGCGDVTNITATAYSPSRVLIRWTNPAGATSDTLLYRKTGTTTWSKIFVTGQEYELNNLEPNKDYEYAVIPLCNTTTVYLASQTQTFHTAALENGIYIRLFPNPVFINGRLEIITDKPYTLQVLLYDGNGKKIREISAKENVPAGQAIKQISAAALPAGIYHIVAVINDKSHTIKMLVSH